MFQTRRYFLSGLSTAVAATWTQSLRAAPDPKKDVVMENGDLIICQWNAFQTYPIKLERV